MDTTSRDHSASDATDPVDLSPSIPQSLHRAVFARRAEYTRPHRIRIKVGSWNVAACPGTDKDLASWFIDGKGLDVRLAAFDLGHNSMVESQSSRANTYQDSTAARLLGGDKVGLYVLGLQEVVNLNPVTQYVYSDTNPTDKWRLALEAALPEGYQFVTSEHMSGLLLLLYASSEVAACVGSISTKVVGTGVGGWFGNKGATAARIVLGETTKVVFVNSHLSSGSDASALERRCWDVKSITERVRFDPIALPGHDRESVQDRIGDEDCVFWFGDLNFRLDSIPGDDIRRLLTLHTRGEYDLSLPKPNNLDGEEGIIATSASDSNDEQPDDTSARSQSTEQSNDDDFTPLPDPEDFEPDPHGDPSSLQATLDSLLPHDQLRRLMKEGRVFHGGWHEGSITFLPSYKYDVGTIGLFDTSEKKRAPSWCDRIVFRTKADVDSFKRKTGEEEEVRKRDEDMKARGIDHAADDDEVLFDYDPENDGDTNPDGKPGLDYDEYDEAGDDAGPNGNEIGVEERLKLDVYTSHQRITSSDHKPVVAIFTLDFDAIVPELKAEVHAEVARELDRAENEGRPSITIAFEGSHSGDDLVDFGDIRYLDKREAHLTLANTGRVPAVVSFVERPSIESGNGESTIPQWLSASLVSSELSDATGEGSDLGKVVTLEPGETVNAHVQVLVNEPSQARMLNEGRERLEEVLVLRVADGRDHFLPVRAAWLPTCIGRSIDELIRVPDGGIRDFVASSSPNKEGKYPKAIPFDADIHRSAPKELFKLIEAFEVLTDRTIADEQMLGSYTIPKDKHGWPFEDCVAGPHDHLLSSVINNLDTDRPIADAFSPEINPCQRLETVADVLVLFLQGLTDGVISKLLWVKIEQTPIRALGPLGTSSDTLEDDKTAILDVLANAPNHNICFVFLTTTLAKIIGELAPVKKSATDVFSRTSTTPSSAIGAIARRSISFRRSVTGGTNTAAIATMTEAVEAMQRRKAGEERVAQIFGRLVCRVPAPAKEKERKGLEGKMAAVVELFLRARNDGN